MIRIFQQISGAPAFHHLSVAMIFCAGVLAGLETHVGLMREHGWLLRSLDMAVVAFFVLEIAVRVGAFGRQPWRFFYDAWNTFDFAIVALCLLPAAGPFAAVLRLARVLRLLRLITAVPKLQLLVGALLKSLSAMGYVGLLLALMAYMYGVIGVHLFGVHDPTHFGSLGGALLTLFKVITLDNWSDILEVVHPYAPISSTVYFVSFIFMGTMIMLNLFIGIIMNSMSAMHAEIEEREREQSSLTDELRLLERQAESLRQQAALVRHRLSVEAEAPHNRPAAPVAHRVRMDLPVSASPDGSF